MLKKILVLMLAVVVVFGLAACASGTPVPSAAATTVAPTVAPATVAPSAAPSAAAPSADPTKWTKPAEASKTYDRDVLKDPIVIGFNNGSTTVDFLRIVEESMKAAADKYGVKLIVTESNFDTEKIMPNVNTLLMQNAQMIVDFNVNAQVGGSLVDYCGAKNVPVLGIDVQYNSPTGKQGYFFGANNQLAGETAGKGLAKAVQDKWAGQLDALVLFFNSENGDLVKKRLTGIADGLKAAGINLAADKITLIDMGGGGSDTTLVGNQKMTDWLTAHPDVHHIGVGTVNTETGQGVFSAVQTANRDKDVLLVTNNNGNQTLNAFAQGDNCWVGGTAYSPQLYGDYIIPMCLDILAGKTVPKVVTMDHTFLTRADIPTIKLESGIK